MIRKTIISIDKREAIELILKSKGIKFDYSRAFQHYYLKKGKAKSDNISAYELYNTLVLKKKL